MSYELLPLTSTSGPLERTTPAGVGQKADYEL